jgi:hypothetical protein
MKRSGMVTGVAVGVFLVGGSVAAAQDTDLLVAAAEEAADEAADRAREIAEEAADLEADAADREADASEGEAAENAAEHASEAAEEAAERADEGGESQGFGSEAFRERHAMLAAKFEERGHPVFDEHPALRVHRSLANGERPTGVGEEQAAAARRMAEARQQMAE